MIRTSLFSVAFAVTDYEQASNIIVENGSINRSFGVSALAVHGLIEAVRDPELREMVNSLDLVVPDGQPIKWALNNLYGAGLKDRVYGPTLMLNILKKADEQGLRVFLYGSTPHTIEKLSAFIGQKYPRVVLCGTHIDRFREATSEEDLIDIDTINDSGAHIVFVGRGCPRQERWVAAHLGKVCAAMVAVGAAFDFHAGNLRQAPDWMQKNGLEWLFRLIQEPKRLWKRYFVTNSWFIMLLTKAKMTLIFRRICKSSATK